MPLYERLVSPKQARVTSKEKKKRQGVLHKQTLAIFAHHSERTVMGKFQGKNQLKCEDLS